MSENNGGTQHTGNGVRHEVESPGRVMLALLRWTDRRADRSFGYPWHEEMLSGECTLAEAAERAGVPPLAVAGDWITWAEWKMALWRVSGEKLGLPESELVVVARVIGWGLQVILEPFDPVSRQFSFLSGDDG